MLIWLYVLSIAVLIGAALNASFDRIWPDDETAGARLELVRRLRAKAVAARMREVGLDDQVPAWEDLSAPKTHELHADLAESSDRVKADREAESSGRRKSSAPPRKRA